MKSFLPILLILGVSSVLAQKPQLIVPSGHTNEITAVAISPDGKYILTGSGDNTAKLWDLSGREIRSFVGHKFVIGSVAFSPDGKSVLTGSHDGTAKLWKISGGQPKTFKGRDGHKNYVTAVAFSPDGKSVLTGSYDKTAKLWDINGHVRRTIALSSRVYAVAFSPDGKVMLTGEENGNAKCWSLSGGLVQTFKHTGAVKSAVFSFDGKLVLTGCLDGTAKVWNMAGNHEQTFKRLSAVHSVAFSPNKQLILIGGFEDGIVELYTITGHKRLEYKGHEWGVNAAVFSPDGQYVLTGSADRTARLWDINGETKQVFDRHSSEITTIACSPDGRFLLSGNTDGGIKLADLSDLAIQSFSGHKGVISKVAFSPDGKSYFTGSHDGKAKQWDLSGKEIQSFKGHKGQINSVAVSPDGQSILTGSFDNSAMLWPVSGGGAPIVLKHPDEVLAVSFSPDGKVLLTGSADGVARLWSLSGDMGQTVTVSSQVKALAFSPDGKMVVTGAYNGLTQLWDVSTQPIQPIQTMGRPGSEVLTVSFSPDGKTVMAGFADKTAKIWNVADGQLVHTLTGHSAELTAVTFLADGKSAITGSKDGTMKFWEPVSGKEQASLIQVDEKDWVVMSPSGLFNASPDAMKIMYYVDNLEVVALEQIKERYFEPYLLRKALGRAPGGVRSVDGLTKLPLFPQVTSASIEDDMLQAKIEKRSGGMGRIALLLDDNMELEANVNPDGSAEFSFDLSRFSDHFIAGSNNRLSLRTYNAAGSLKSQPYWLDYIPSGVQGKGLNNNRSSLSSKKDAKLESINLYALMIGTSNYRGEQLNLKFPDKDATAFAEALKATGSKLFGDNIEVKLMTTSTEPWPRKAEVAAALREIAAKADPNDILLVYLSGHGITYPPNSEKGQFYYLTTDILSDKLDDPSILTTQAIAQDTLQEWIRQVTARKRILILDACNSGRVVEKLSPGEKALNSDQRRALERMKDRSGMFVLAGSAADKSSYEASRFGHGLLTYSLLNNMPKVAADNKSFIDVSKLFNNILEEVPRLAKEIGRVQKPELIGSGSFDIGIIDGEIPYEIPQTIPVFLRTNFTDKRARDGVRLSKAVNGVLEGLANEKIPALTFWDLAEFGGDHFYLGGQYQVDGENIKGEAWLYQKDKELKAIPFGPGSSVDALAEEIMDSVIAYFEQQNQK